MDPTTVVPVKIKRMSPEAKIPQFQYYGDAGADLYAIVEATLQPLERQAIPTGISVEIPIGYELQVRPRSGLALQHGITVLNTPGTIDFGYRGEIKVILINLGDAPFHITKGLKIAQIVLAPVAQAIYEEVVELSETERGGRGFGSTGLV
jgi:dUTP pyrophosphatase